MQTSNAKFDEAGKVLQTTAPVGRALNLPPGAPYGRAELDSAQRALLSLIASGGS